MVRGKPGPRRRRERRALLSRPRRRPGARLRRLVGPLERPLPRLRGGRHAAAAAEPLERLADRPGGSRPLRGGDGRDPRPRPRLRRRAPGVPGAARGRLRAGLVPAQRRRPASARSTSTRSPTPRGSPSASTRTSSTSASTTASATVTGARLPRLRRGRPGLHRPGAAPTACAPAASRTRGCFSTSPARFRKASATGTTSSAASSPITCAWRSAR